MNFIMVCARRIHCADRDRIDYARQPSPSIEVDKPSAAGSGHLARGLIAAEEIQMNDIKLKCQRHAARMQFYD